MKYYELAKLRAKQLYDNNVITLPEYEGYSRGHVCWYSICVNEREDWWICEECCEFDPTRCPSI